MYNKLVEGVVGGVLNRHRNKTLDENKIQILMVEIAAVLDKTLGNSYDTSKSISITAANKQWLAMIASHRAAFNAINQDQNAWGLATTQSKLNVCDSVWSGFLSDLKTRKADITADLNL